MRLAPQKLKAVVLYVNAVSTDAAYNFAAEEYITGALRPKEPVWMFWRADKCVMLGRNQIAGAEVDLAAAAREGVSVVRRASGGGAIYADLNTVQYTLILPYNGLENAREIARGRLAGPVVSALNEAGVRAVWGGRNDIYADGKKISGTAQYILRDRICSHGSLLFGTDLAALEKVLRPDEDKIKSKALRSANAGVTTLRQYFGGGGDGDAGCDSRFGNGVRDFMEYLAKAILRSQNAGELIFSAGDDRQINIIREKKYANKDWNYGAAPKYTLRNQKRFPGGKIETFVEVAGGSIKNCDISGDFLGLLPASDLAAHMVSAPYRYEDVSETLARADVSLYLGDISKEQLLSCLFDAE